MEPYRLKKSQLGACRIGLSMWNRPVGFVRSTIALSLASLDGFQVTSTGINMTAPASALGGGHQLETLDEAVQTLRSQGLVSEARAERCEIVDLEDPTKVLASVDRSALIPLGIPMKGVHTNGLVSTSRGLRMWLAKRGSRSPSHPGKYDNLAAGLVAMGQTLDDAMLSETWDEASVPPEAAALATEEGALDYCCAVEGGLAWGRIFIFDLLLPLDFRPHNRDGSVDHFELWALDDLRSIMDNDRHFKFTSALVVKDCIRRTAGSEARKGTWSPVNEAPGA